MGEKVFGKEKATRLSCWQLLDCLAMKAFRECAPDLSVVNLDRERILSWIRAHMKGDQAHNLSTTFNSSFVWQMRHEQESRGGITVAGSAKAKELNDYNLEVLMRRQQTPKHEIVTTAMNGWIFYFLERIANVWRSTQGTKEEIALKGGKRATNTKGERAYRVLQAQPTSQPDGAQDDQAQVRYVNIKGQGAWHSWQLGSADRRKFTTMMTDYDSNGHRRR